MKGVRTGWRLGRLGRPGIHHDNGGRMLVCFWYARRRWHSRS
jgi:hypothetical protein